MKNFETFSRESLMWRINRERLILLGGPAAAILQVAYPKVAMGVVAHSKFNTDPLGRLSRTLEAVYTVAFGTSKEVEHTKKKIEQIHLTVRGLEPESYSAFDPNAQLWVLATLISTSVMVYERFFKSLNVSELDQFIKDYARFGEIFGLNARLFPKNWMEFQEYYNSTLHGDYLGSSPLCVEAANSIICPHKPMIARLLSPLTRGLVVQFLPEKLLKRLQIEPGLSSRYLWSSLDQFLPSLILETPSQYRYASKYLEAQHRDYLREGKTY